MEIDSVRDRFITDLEEGKLFHAFLLFGGSSEERNNFVKSFANFLENKEFAFPSKTLCDFLEFGADAEEDIGIEAARGLKDFLLRSPGRSLRRVLLFSRADALTPAVQNTMLKIVEEPPENTLIFFSASTENTVLETLLSRLTRIYFGSTKEESEEKEPDIVLPEGPMTDEEATCIISRLIAFYRGDVKRNSGKIKILLRRLGALKNWNTNKKLQIRAAMAEIGLKAPSASRSFRNGVK